MTLNPHSTAPSSRPSPPKDWSEPIKEWLDRFDPTSLTIGPALVGVLIGTVAGLALFSLRGADDGDISYSLESVTEVDPLAASAVAGASGLGGAEASTTTSLAGIPEGEYSLPPEDERPSLIVLAAMLGSEDEAVAAEAEPAPTSAPTTAKPTTTAPPSSETTAAPEETTTSEAADSTDTSEGEEGESTTTTVDETTTTEAETTTTESTTTTAADNGWVDTGNGVMVPPVLLKIRYCESRDNYTAANPVSSARGAYQFLTGSWAAYGHADRYGVNQAHLATPAQQDEAALITWERDGTRPWNASRHCWG